jgi:hypothetical protein
MRSLSFLGVSMPAALQFFRCTAEEKRSIAKKRLEKKCEDGLKGA